MCVYACVSLREREMKLEWYLIYMITHLMKRL